jgi:hypothetical protein
VGLSMKPAVTECETDRRLAWSTLVEGDETGSSAYHGGLITRTATGCHLLTEETQQSPFFLELVGRKHPGALYAAISRNGLKAWLVPRRQRYRGRRVDGSTIMGVCSRCLNCNT